MSEIISLGVDFEKSNVIYVDGLTFEKVKIYYPWILNATVKDIIIGENDYGLVWYSGEWFCGEWFDGTWYSGIFHSGSWLNGHFYSYNLNKYDIISNELIIIDSENTNSKFISGLWHNGFWYGGVFGQDNNEIWEDCSLCNIVNYDYEKVQVSTYCYYKEQFGSSEIKYKKDSNEIIVYFNTPNPILSKFSIGEKILLENINHFSGEHIITNIITNSSTNKIIELHIVIVDDNQLIELHKYPQDSTENINYFITKIHSSQLNNLYIEVPKKYPIWLNGTFKNGLIYDSVWNNGIFLDGYIKNSIWINGKFYFGVFDGHTWYNGEWYNGDFIRGKWLNGIFSQLSTDKISRFGANTIISDVSICEWYDGSWKNGQWFSGYQKIGDVELSLNNKMSFWYGGNWYGGNWYGGHFKNGTWYSGNWYSGIFGDYQSTEYLIPENNEEFDNHDFDHIHTASTYHGLTALTNFWEINNQEYKLKYHTNTYKTNIGGWTSTPTNIPINGISAVTANSTYIFIRDMFTQLDAHNIAYKNDDYIGQWYKNSYKPSRIVKKSNFTEYFQGDYILEIGGSGFTIDQIDYIGEDVSYDYELYFNKLNDTTKIIISEIKSDGPTLTLILKTPGTTGSIPLNTDIILHNFGIFDDIYKVIEIDDQGQLVSILVILTDRMVGEIMRYNTHNFFSNRLITFGLTRLTINTGSTIFNNLLSNEIKIYTKEHLLYGELDGSFYGNNIPSYIKYEEILNIQNKVVFVTDIKPSDNFYPPLFINSPININTSGEIINGDYFKEIYVISDDNTISEIFDIRQIVHSNNKYLIYTNKDSDNINNVGKIYDYSNYKKHSTLNSNTLLFDQFFNTINNISNIKGIEVSLNYSNFNEKGNDKPTLDTTLLFNDINYKHYTEDYAFTGITIMKQELIIILEVDTNNLEKGEKILLQGFGEYHNYRYIYDTQPHYYDGNLDFLNGYHHINNVDDHTITIHIYDHILLQSLYDNYSNIIVQGNFIVSKLIGNSCSLKYNINNSDNYNNYYYGSYLENYVNGTRTETKFTDITKYGTMFDLWGLGDLTNYHTPSIDYDITDFNSLKYNLNVSLNFNIHNVYHSDLKITDLKLKIYYLNQNYKPIWKKGVFNKGIIVDGDFENAYISSAIIYGGDFENVEFGFEHNIERKHKE